MSNVFYAVFPTREQAAAGIRAVRQQGVPEEHFSFIVHDERIKSSGDLAIRETDGLEGTLLGGTIGAIAGVLTMGVIATPVGLAGMGALATAALGAAAGGTYGALGAGLASLGLPNPDLETLMPQLEAGGVLVTVTSDEPHTELAIEQIFAQHGATEAERHVL